jgi:uncharacterized OB-fold protein
MGAAVPVRQGLFDTGDDEPRLIGSRCRRCSGHHFPRHATCPYCASDEVEETRLSPRGTLWAFTAVTAAPPGYRGEVPYGFGVVELPEGVRVVTRLTEPDPAALRVGQPMELVVVALHEDDDGNEVVTYAFAPERRR